MMHLKSLLLAGVLSLAALGGALAQDMTALSRELSLQKITDKSFKLAFWLPPEIFMAGNANMGAAQLRQLRAMLQGHAVFFVAETEAGVVGMGAGKPRAELVKTMALVINDGQRISPMPESEINQDIKLLLDLMKPMMKSQLGKLGDALEPMVFRVPRSEGDAGLLMGAGKGRIKVLLSGDEFAWRLPLGSLLPPNVDAETGEQFPGNFVFNPFTGRKLVPK